MVDDAVPPEVVLDAHGRQVLALTEQGARFSRYIECEGGCGWLIGVGDAVDTVSHESCAVVRPPTERQCGERHLAHRQDVDVLLGEIVRLGGVEARLRARIEKYERGLDEILAATSEDPEYDNRPIVAIVKEAIA